MARIPSEIAKRENRVHDMLLVACCDDIVWGCAGAKLTIGTDLKEQGTSQLSEKELNMGYFGNADQNISKLSH